MIHRTLVKNRFSYNSWIVMDHRIMPSAKGCMRLRRICLSLNGDVKESVTYVRNDFRVTSRSGSMKIKRRKKPLFGPLFFRNYSKFKSFVRVSE